MTLRLESPTKRARSNRAAIDCRSKAASDEKPLLLLNGLQIIDDRAHVLRRENELRHVGVTSRKALGQSLGKAFDLVFARELRNGGAAMCGLVPVRPTAWQRAQFVVSNNSPRPVGVVASCAKAGAVTLMAIIVTRQ